MMKSDHYNGQWGTSNAPEKCPDCGNDWFGAERLHTGDDNGLGGWEDWMYCQHCGCELFFPVVNPPCD